MTSVAITAILASNILTLRPEPALKLATNTRALFAAAVVTTKKKFSASKPGRRLQLRRLPLPDRHLPGPVPSRRQQARPLWDVQVQQEADRVEPSQDLQRDHGTVSSNTFTNHRAMPITRKQAWVWWKFCPPLLFLFWLEVKMGEMTRVERLLNKALKT
jgi:hypothetical protein